MNCGSVEFLELSKDILSQGACLRFQACGGSMSPFIRNGDILNVEPAKAKDIKLRDVIFYRTENRIIAHRVIKKVSENGKVFLVTKGDSSPNFDQHISRENILGKVVAVERKGKVIKIDRGIFGLLNLFCAYISPFSRYIYPVLRKIKHALAKSKKEREYFFRQRGKMEDEYLSHSVAAATCGNKLGPSRNLFLTGIEDKIKKDFDWNYFLNRARKNGVSPLLYFYQKEEKESFPKNFFEELEKDYYQTLTRNILIWEEMKPILKSLEEKKIEVILLKGIALGVTIYPSLGLRPMSDVDILIKDEDIFKIDETLNRFGYFPADINPQDIELGKTEYRTTLSYPGKNLSLHLHRHLVNSTIPNFSYISKINMERIWQKARPIEIFGIKALILSPEHLIIYLCEHSLRVTHSLSRLIFLADISQAINYYQDKIDWDFLAKESYNFGLERMVYCGLYSVNRILGTEVPFNILSFLKPKRLTSGEKIFLSLVAKNRSSPGLSYLVHLAMNKKSSEKIKFLFRTLFPPKKVLGQRNCIPPSKINYLHYFSRLKRVLRHVLISILH